MSRELDVRVARALGCDVYWDEWHVGGRYPACRCRDRKHVDPSSYLPHQLYHYCSDIAAAWGLFERLGPAWCISQTDPSGWDDAFRWWCWLPVEYGGDGTQHMARTAPEAICKAFLAWKEAQDG